MQSCSTDEAKGRRTSGCEKVVSSSLSLNCRLRQCCHGSWVQATTSTRSFDTFPDPRARGAGTARAIDHQRSSYPANGERNCHTFASHQGTLCAPNRLNTRQFKSASSPPFSFQLRKQAKRKHSRDVLYKRLGSAAARCKDPPHDTLNIAPLSPSIHLLVHHAAPGADVDTGCVGLRGNKERETVAGCRISLPQSS